jgi:ribosomal protein S20
LKRAIKEPRRSMLKTDTKKVIRMVSNGEKSIWDLYQDGEEDVEEHNDD